MDILLSKIYYSIKGHKRFFILFATGIHAEFIVGNNIYLNWRTFGKVNPLTTTLYYTKYKNLILLENITKKGKKSKIYFSEQYPSCSSLLETNNFLIYVLNKSINKNIEIIIFT